MDAPNRGYLALLRRQRHFRRLWLGELVSFTGDWFNFIALYAAVQGLSSSGKAIAAVMVAKTLPIFLVAPIAGPIVDRFDRRKLMVFTSVARALCGAALVGSYLAGSLVGLYACTVLMMCGTGLAVPTKNAVLPMIVPRADVAAANALSGGTWSAMLAIGAALGGVATAYLGITAAFVIDACTFVVAALLFVSLPPLPPPTDEAPEKVTFSAGLAYLRRNPYIAALASCKWMMQLSGGLVVLIPFYGTVVFSGASGSVFVGGLFAARGVGALVGSLVLRRLFGDAPATMRKLILVAFVVEGASYALLSQSTQYWHAIGGYFGAALGQSAVWVFSGTLLQIEGDPAYHGRVFGIEFGLNTLVLGGMSFLAGAALDWGYGFEQVALTLASLSVLPVLFWGSVVLARQRGAATAA